LVANDKKLLNNITLGIKEFKNNNWEQRLQQLKSYIEVHGKMPSSESADQRTKQLGIWNLNQKQNYKNNRYDMTNDAIRKIWEEFVKENSSLYRTRENKWMDHLNSLELYIQEHNKLPSEDAKADEKTRKLAKWWSEQKYKYNTKSCILQYQKFRDIWSDFTSKHSDLFLTKDEAWKRRLIEAEKFIIEHNALPVLSDNNENIQSLAKWLYRQKDNYLKNKNSLEKDDNRVILYYNKINHL
jgi:hypothetical protein